MTPEQIALIVERIVGWKTEIVGGLVYVFQSENPRFDYWMTWNPETNAADCEEFIVKLNKCGFYLERWDCPEGRDCSATIVDRLGEELICCDAATTREAVAAAALWLCENGKVGK